jgi:hypothetical protein
MILALPLPIAGGETINQNSKIMKKNRVTTNPRSNAMSLSLGATSRFSNSPVTLIQRYMPTANTNSKNKSFAGRRVESD